MKVVYITSYTFPSTRAEPYYLKSMAQAFVHSLGSDFLLMIRGKVPDELCCANAVSVHAPSRFKLLWYFFWFPFMCVKRKYRGNDVVFISNDPYLLIIFTIWKILSMSQYKICADWHQLFDDWKDHLIAYGATYNITTSKRLKELLVARCHVPEQKVLVAYGGIVPEPFLEKRKIPKEVLRKKLKLPEDKFLVGYLGGFVSVGFGKGLDTMIQALPYLNENIMLIFVGGAKDHRGEYEKLAQNLGLNHRCIFIGKQQFETLVEYEVALDVLAIPYPNKPHFRDYGFPLKVWEYMAAGRPIVYSNLAIIGEILEGCGIPFVPDNPESFAKVVSSVYEDVHAADTMAEKNTRNVYAYTWDERVSKIVKFIRREKYGESKNNELKN